MMPDIPEFLRRKPEGPKAYDDSSRHESTEDKAL